MKVCPGVYMGLFLSAIFCFCTLAFASAFIVLFTGMFGITMFHLGEHAVAYRVRTALDEPEGDES